MEKYLYVFGALLIVLVLIGGVAWLVRKFGAGNAGSGANRGRMPRLAVIDAAAVDNRRKLVLVRRDNVEHLIMIGGPTDVVVEPNIQRNMPQRDQAAQRGPAGTELPARHSPLPDANWQDAETFEHREPAMPEPPARAARAPYPDEMRRPSPPIADYDAAPSFAPEPVTREPRIAAPRSERVEPPMPPRMPRANDIPAKAPPRASRQEPLPSSADQNLADMAQRLEAALRRPGSELRLDGGETRAPAVSAADRVGAPPPPSRSASRAAASAAPAAKPGFDNLEDEMASLLGRPKPPA